MKKLLIVTTVPIVITNFLLPFAAYFRDRGWQVDAMSSGFSSADRFDQFFDRLWEVQWSRNPLDPRNLLGTPTRIKEIALREQYDIIHVHTPVAAFVTRYALKDIRHRLKTKIIYTAHGFHFYKGGSFLRNAVFLGLEKLAGGWMDYLVTIVQEDRDAALKYRLAAPDRIRYMPGIGVDLDYYHRNTVSDLAVAQFRQELAVSAETHILLTIAELNANKRHVDAISAFAKLARTDVHYVLASTGPLTEKIQQLAVKLGVADRVHFLGRRSDVPVLMTAATANILVSAREGLPRTILESLALELPTIGTKVRGTQDLLAGGYGLLVDVGDVEGLTTAITWMLEQPQAAHNMAKRGREHIASYSLNCIIKLHEELYAEAMAVRSIEPLSQLRMSSN